MRIWWVVTMVDDEKAAQDICRNSIKQGLAACAQLESPVISIYGWEGEVVEGPEYRVVFKTSTAKRKPLMAWLEGAHPYEVPEILAWPVQEALPEYAKWVEEA